MSVHYKFGGSTADRTVNCPAWVNLSKNMPSGPASMAAMEGTLMHLLFERGVEDPDFEPNEMVGESREIDGQVLTVTPEHTEKVYTALEVLDDMVEQYDWDAVWPEVVMSTDDDTGGTADIIAWTYRDSSKTTLKSFAVGDLKTGDGFMVYAEDNKQLLFYAWQAIEKYKHKLDFHEETAIDLFIIQPSDRRDDPMDVWTTDMKTVMKFKRDFLKAQKHAKAGIKEPCPGSHCKYCPAEPVCPAKKGMIQASRRIPKESVELDDLIKALSMVDDVEAWCRAVRKTAHEQAEAGVKLPGFKLVAKRATRQWIEPAEAEHTFKNARSLKAEDYYNQTLRSPAQLEKVCKAKGVDFGKYESMIHLHSSGTTLVKDSDKRPEALPLPALQDMAKRLKS